MENVTDIINKLRRMNGHFRPALQRVADLALADLDFMATATTAEIARRAGVSEPTLIRFCRALGCAGVRDFKLKLAQNLAVGLQYLQPPDSGDDTIAAILERVLGSAAEAFKLLRVQLNQEAVAQAARAIAHARKVDIYGVGGGSSALAQEMQNRLFRLGVLCNAYADGHLQRMSASTLGDSDVVLAISATGLPQELRDGVRIARQYGAKAICLTHAGSPLAGCADLAITLDIPESTDIFKPSALRLAQLGALDVLATAVAHELAGQAKENLRRIRSTLAALHGDAGPRPIGD